MYSSCQSNSELLDSPVAAAMIKLFEHIPDTYFFVKDSQSRFVHVNQALLQRIGLEEVSQIVGTSDHDRYPPHVADQLVEGDKRVMESGDPFINHADILFDYRGRLEWFSTSKYPILDDDGTPLGVVGTTRRFPNRQSRKNTDHAAENSIDFICANPTSRIRVTDLAEQFGISERQLHRQFIKVIGMNPQNFILRTRIQASAADLRKTTESLADLATKYGFCDQSAYSRQFWKLIGTTPGEYRKINAQSQQ